MSSIQTFKSKVASIAAWYIFVSTRQSNRSSIHSFSFPFYFTAPSCSGGVGRDGISSCKKQFPQNKNAFNYKFRSNRDERSAREIGSSCLLATSSIHQEYASIKTRRTCQENEAGKGKEERHYNTEADKYFKKHRKIPQPMVTHDNIEQMMKNDQRISGDGTCCESGTQTRAGQNDSDKSVSSKVLIIGDVHGCLNELKLLVRKAQKEKNDNQPFRCIILVGDLCNKGPNSAEVIKYVRKQRHWFTVRGNHDDGALAAALGDPKRRTQPNYAWVFAGQTYNDNNNDVMHVGQNSDSYERNMSSSLSDEDVKWMSNIPYTITIPKSFWRNENQDKDNFHHQDDDDDIIIVHAGFIPNIPLESQDIKTLVTIRDVVSIIDTQDDRSQDKGSNNKSYKYYEGDKHSDSSSNGSGQSSQDVQPWAKAWKGPQLVIFGHDAKRGLQLEKFAIGLDTGCTYGKELSAIILPSKDVISVKAEMIHCPIVQKEPKDRMN